MSDHDVLVIGGGSPGEQCSYWACIPSMTPLAPHSGCALPAGDPAALPSSEAS